MFAKDQEKHAKPINEEKECDMKSSFSTNKMSKITGGESVETNCNSVGKISSPYDQSKKKKKEGSENLDHLSSFQDIKIDESCAMSEDGDESEEEHGNKENKTNSGSATNAIISHMDDYKDENEIVSSDDNLTDDAGETCLTEKKSDMLRSKSFISLAPKSDLFHLSKNNSNSRKHSSTINLAHDGLQNDVIIEYEQGRAATPNASMKPPIHPPIPASKFGISRKTQRKNLSLDNGLKQVVGIDSPSTQRKSDAGGVVLRREKTQIISSPTSKIQNRLSWGNSSLKGSKDFGGSTNSLLEFMPDNHTQQPPGLPKISSSSSTHDFLLINSS